MSVRITSSVQHLFSVVTKRAAMLVSTAIAEPSHQGPSPELFEGVQESQEAMP